MSDEQRYRVTSKIAAGGMAEVFRGESSGIEGFRKKVAIKRVLPKLSENQEFISMFLDEARLCAYLTHSKCVQVFDIGQANGAHFIVMEFVDGADLKGVLEHLQKEGKQMPVETAVFIAMQVCEGLAYAHNATDHGGKPLHIVHRDVSPHNVLMTKYGEVKLVDFGLAKASSHLTGEDEDIVKGKFGYLAPEITRGKGADARVDIFAAGILLWEMLAGKRLFLGNSDVETFKQVQAANIPDLRPMRPDVTDDLMNVLWKGLAKDPGERYQTADDFAEALAKVLTDLPGAATYRDVARIVRAAAKDRSSNDDGASQADLMGDLIIEALHDFSALFEEEERAEEKPQKKADAGFVDPTAWLDDEPEPEAKQEEPKPAEKAAPPAKKEPPPKPEPAKAEPPPKKEPPAKKEPPKQEAPPPKREIEPVPQPPPASGGNVMVPWIIAVIAIAAAIAGWVR